jgi:hypothetical protein
MVGENAQMLSEQIDEEKGKTTGKKLPSVDKETEIPFSAPVKMRGLEVTDIQVLVVAQRPKAALFGRVNDFPLSECVKATSSYFGNGVDKIQEGKESRRGMYHTKEHIRRLY